MPFTYFTIPNVGVVQGRFVNLRNDVENPIEDNVNEEVSRNKLLVRKFIGISQLACSIFLMTKLFKMEEAPLCDMSISGVGYLTTGTSALFSIMDFYFFSSGNQNPSNSRGLSLKVQLIISTALILSSLAVTSTCDSLNDKERSYVIISCALSVAQLFPLGFDYFLND